MRSLDRIWRILSKKQANLPSVIFHLCSVVFSMAALLSTDWIVVNDDYRNSTKTFYDPGTAIPHYDNADSCMSIGCLDFVKPARFGAFVDEHGEPHYAFHSNGRVLIDCATPEMANLFYVIIALCFVIGIISSFSCSINFMPPPDGFINWIRTNSILEMINMMLTLCACVTAIVIQTDLAYIRSDDNVTIGSGVFMVCLCGLFSFAAAMASIRHSTQLNRMRRIDNQRLLCARSLRSWRDAARRPDDTRPIVDFERYLDESAAEMDTVTTTKDTSNI